MYSEGEKITILKREQQNEKKQIFTANVVQGLKTEYVKNY